MKKLRVDHLSKINQFKTCLKKNKAETALAMAKQGQSNLAELIGR